MTFLSKYKWHIFISIVILYVIGMIGVGIYAYDFASRTLDGSPIIEVVKFEMIALGGLGVILPIYFSVCQSILAEAQKEFDNKRYILDNTMHMIEKWDDQSLLNARKFTRRIKDKHHALSPDAICAEIQNDEELRNSVILVFNYIDTLRISLEHNRVDEKIIKHCLGDIVLSLIDRFDPWLKMQDEAVQKDINKLEVMLKKR